MSEGIKLTEKEMKYIQMFETVTGAAVIDCVEEGETLTFIVRQGDMRKALSNKGSKIKELVRVFKKRIKVVEFTTD
ncbi:MAG: hypothetical protein QXT91_05485, partial [Candidatus Caldarchaeum sp.]